MGPQEAAYAVEMVNRNIAVPIHYGTWPPIDSDPNEFKEVLEDISETEVLIPVIGKEFLQ